MNAKIVILASLLIALSEAPFVAQADDTTRLDQTSVESLLSAPALPDAKPKTLSVTTSVKPVATTTVTPSSPVKANAQPVKPVAIDVTPKLTPVATTTEKTTTTTVVSSKKQSPSAVSAVDVKPVLTPVVTTTEKTTVTSTETTTPVPSAVSKASDSVTVAPVVTTTEKTTTTTVEVKPVTEPVAVTPQPIQEKPAKVEATQPTEDKPTIFLNVLPTDLVKDAELKNNDTQTLSKTTGGSSAPEQVQEATTSEDSAITESKLISQTIKTPNLMSFYELGKFYFQAHKYDKAEAAFVKAQENGRQVPTDAAYIDSVYYLGDIYYNTARYAESEKKYRQVMTLGLNDDELHSYLGDALRKQSKYKQAKLEYEKALQLNADNTIAKEGIDNVCKSMKCD